MINPALQAMEGYRQFILWKLQDGVKVPLNPTDGKVGNAHDSSNWLSYAEAESLAALWQVGIGFVFTDNDPFFFLDIDHCADDGRWSDLSIAVCNSLPGCAIEVSQSGQGLHIFGTYSQIPPHRCKNSQLGLELYHTGRFVAMTQINMVGNVSVDATAMLPSVIGTWFPYDGGAEVDPDWWTTNPVSEWSGIEDNEQLIKAACKSKSAGSIFGGKASFQDLWEANEEVLGECYPPMNDTDPYDRSQADAALAQHLAFWTGKNCERIHTLMRLSKLVRPKWDKHRKYLGDTIRKAVAQQKDVMKSKKSEDVIVSEGVRIKGGYDYCPVADQPAYFAGCWYVINRHQVFSLRHGFLKPDQFKATFSGKHFQTDNDKTTKNAWEAFVESTTISFPKVTSTCFRPDIPEGAIIHDEGVSKVNTYIPIETRKKAGDVSPFLIHLSMMLPDPRDRDILLSWMAACVQFPGCKFQWAPIIQGVEGNGKTILLNAMAHCMGHRYTHRPSSNQLADSGGKFNAWMDSKLLIGIEELKVSDRFEIIEIMKPWITNEFIEVQGKGKDQYVIDNRANFLILTNYKDAMPVTDSSRRYCIFYTAQQTDEDKVKYGMDGPYFEKMHDWLRSEGFEIINNFLHNYQVNPIFNPAGQCHQAPKTTSTAEAVTLSLGQVEYAILEQISEERVGFKDGWVSSIALNEFLKKNKMDARVPMNKRKQILEGLGYIWHPALTQGRCNQPIPSEGGKPRLFIKKGHPALELKTPKSVMDVYTKSQGYLFSAPDIDGTVSKI